MLKITLSLFLFFNSIYRITCANILFVSCVMSPSHYIYNKALAEGLAARGHNITFISADNEKIPPENIHYIHLEKIYPYFANESEWAKQYEGVEDPLDYSGIPDIAVIMMLYDIQVMLCEATKLSKGYQQILEYPDSFKFDLVIYDYTFSLCLLGLLPKFNYPPLIGISAFSNPSYTADILGGDRLGLTVKPYYTTLYGADMKIHQRIHNGFLNFFESFYRKYFGLPKCDKKTKEMFGANTPYIGDLEKTMSLALVNSNPMIDFAESLPPNVIEVGGLQIKAPKPVESDISEFLSKGKKGAVLVSFGTNFRSDQFGSKRIEAIVEALRQLPDYNFIWKFETTEMLKNLPPNVMTRAWLSQSDILAHASIKAFVSHSGLLSTQEASWRGVPIVGVPIFVDQHRNLQKSISAGIAVKVDFNSITPESLKKALLEVLENSKYRENALRRSKIFKDQPETPLQRAVWWCEYIIRNPNASHLKQAEFNLGLLGSHFWDIQILLILIAVTTFMVVRRIFRKLFCSKKKLISNEKKKN